MKHLIALLALLITHPLTAHADEISQGRRMLDQKYSISPSLLRATAPELARQAALPGHVDFLTALDGAARTFLSSQQDAECPLAVQVEQVGHALPGIDAPGPLSEPRRQDRALGALLTEMNRDGASLELMALDQAPEGYEVGFVRANWVFQLHLPGDEHGYWAVVDRQGIQAPFCYGFN